jgi:hypothetical protein
MRLVADATVWVVPPEMAKALAGESCSFPRGSRRSASGSCLNTQAHKRYVGVVRTVGGLKLALEGAVRNDRRVRFANVSLSAADAKDDVALVTDSQGRMRYRLRDGEYRLRVAGGRESRFTVRDGRWTTVRMRLL